MRARDPLPKDGNPFESYTAKTSLDMRSLPEVEASRAAALRAEQDTFQAPDVVARSGIDAGLTVAAVWEAKNPGFPTGDFFLSTTLPDRRLAVLVGDVQGKGAAVEVDRDEAGEEERRLSFTGAETVIALHRIVGASDLRTLLSGKSAAEGMSGLDTLVSPTLREFDRSFDLALVLVDPATGSCSVSTAGIPFVFLLGPSGVTRFGSSDPAINFLHDPFETSYGEANFVLSPGEVLLAVTDGVTDLPLDGVDFSPQEAPASLGTFLASAPAVDDWGFVAVGREASAPPPSATRS